MLLDAGIRLVHVPGLVVNRARRAAKSGEAKFDPRDAKTIADQLRLRDDLREITISDEITLDLRHCWWFGARNWCRRVAGAESGRRHPTELRLRSR